MTAPGLEAVALTKRFGTFTALDNVTMKVAPGTVHALLGENGAGKSTLVKCIMGYHLPDEGAVILNDRETPIPSPRAAQRYGLGMVYQHFTLAPSLTGLENLAVSRTGGGHVLNRQEERRRIDAARGLLPFDLPLDRKVSDLSSGQKQKLEILKQLYLGARFLILDEPTSVLTPDEADEVLGTLHQLTRDGELTALMISHKFREVMAYADAVTVLRKGQRVGERKVRDTTTEELSQLLVGEGEGATTAGPAPITRTAPGKIILTVRNLRLPAPDGEPLLNVEGFDLRAGEILGVAGVSGNGQRELFECLSGQRPEYEGAVNVDGNPVTHTRAARRALGMHFLPEEPLENAMAGRLSVWENLGISWFDRTRLGLAGFFPDRSALKQRAEQQIADYRIATRSAASPVRDLSGGNVQRVTLAREIATDAKLLIVANPCFGLDFRSAAAVRDRLAKARDQGAAVLLITEDLDELLDLSDRLAVMAGRTWQELGATREV